MVLCGTYLGGYRAKMVELILNLKKAVCSVPDSTCAYAVIVVLCDDVTTKSVLKSCERNLVQI